MAAKLQIVGQLEQTVSGGPRLKFTTKETADLIRQALRQAFPAVKFSVRTDYASCYSATNVRWTDGPTRAEVERVTGRFSSRRFDGMTDSTTYHEHVVDGQRVSYSGWVNCTRVISPALLQKALERYQHERAKYGAAPARLEVHENGDHPYLDGPDKSEMNPCGGAETWSTVAVYAIASTMRPNGVRITLKEPY